jgi:hypothetical protein
VSPASKRAERPPQTRRDVEEPKPGSGSRQARRAAREQESRRYAVIYDIEGPRVRLGIAWFVVAFAALVGGPLSTAVVYGLTAAIAAAQAARSWRRLGFRINEIVAAAGAGAIALGAVLGSGGMGAGLIGAAIAAYAAAASDRKSSNRAIANAGMTLRCALFPGVAAGSMVLLLRLDVGASIALLLLVSAYEIGDFLYGSGASNAIEGPLAGIAAMGVMTFIVSGFPVTSLDVREALVVCGITMLAAPLGQLLASAILPRAGAPASGLRRLDSLLLAAPIWAYSVGILG